MCSRRPAGTRLPIIAHVLGLKRALSIFAFGAILVGGFQPFYLGMFRQDRAAFGRALAEAQYRRTPGLRSFLIDVREQTPRGSVIALFVPMRKWSEGYEYALFRTPYHLTGRTVLPLLRPQTDEVAWENIRRADYIAAWQGEPAFDGFDVIWRGPQGTLLRRRR